MDHVGALDCTEQLKVHHPTLTDAEKWESIRPLGLTPGQWRTILVDLVSIVHFVTHLLLFDVEGDGLFFCLFNP